MSLDSYQDLCVQLGLDRGIPYTPQWSAAADFLQLIVDHALTHKPGVIVECGSGLTTLMLARCCAINGSGHVYSLENGADYAAATHTELSRYGLGPYASVIHAPLQPQTVNGQEYQWYALEQFTAHAIDMLIVDGPPGFIQQCSRYPALPLLWPRLSANSTIFLDDAARPDEREIIARWCSEMPLASFEYLPFERGCAILRT